MPDVKLGRSVLLPGVLSKLNTLAMVIALLLSLPLLTVFASLFWPASDRFQHLVDTVLAGYVINSLWLTVWVGLGTLLVGTATAWLVTMCRFPGSQVLQWALVLPLTVPTYVIAYAYTDFLQHPGPVQTLLRDLTGWGPRDYWFPEIRSLGGAALVFTLVLYPYVYLLARAAFLRPSTAAFDAARSLGRNPWQAFLSISLPMARPALVAGVALAIMETLADFGAVAHFGLPTFTTGIYRTWFSMGDRIAASQLAAGLVTLVALLLLIERLSRGQARRTGPDVERRGAQFPLAGWRGLMAFLCCALPVVLGFVLPVLILVDLAAPHWSLITQSRFLDLIWNTLELAALGAVCCVLIAVLLAYAVRLRPGPITQTTTRLASLGYAMPGSIIAVGILLPLAEFDTLVDQFARQTFDMSTGLLLTGSIAALIYAYMVRFMAIAFASAETALNRVTPAMDAAAKTLGKSSGGILFSIHIPLMRGGLLTACLIVFVDILKELPATLIMRPFNFDTLAVQAHQFASDERLAEAAVPSLMIVGVAMLPVLLLTRQIAKSSLQG